MASQIDVKAVITADDKASQVMSNFGEQTQKATTRIGAAMAAAGAGLTLYAKSATDYTVELTKNTKALGRETGLSAESASSLLYVTQRMGLDADKTQAVFGIFAKKITETAQAADVSQTALGKLGVSVKDADGHTRDFNSILLDTADKFKGMPDGAQKTAEAMELFGRSGKDLIPVLNLGKQGIQDMEKQAEKLGLTLTTDNVAAVTKYIQATKNLTDSQNALKIQIGQLTAPVLANLDNKLASVVSAVVNAAGPFRGLAAAAIAAGGPILSIGGAALSAAANIAQISGALRVAGAALLVASPWLLAITAAVGAGAIAWKLFHDRTESAGKAADDAQDALARQNNTLQEQVTTLDDVNKAWKDYNRAQEDVVGAQLSVEQAQKDYNDAVLTYGANSLQAREAAHQVAEAQYGLQDATDKAATSQQTLNQKQADMSVQAPSAAAAADLVAAHINGITIQSDIASTHVANLSLGVQSTLTQSLNAASVIQNTFGSLQGAANTVQVAVNSAQNTANNLQNTINNLNTSGSRGITLNVNTGGKSIPLRAEGGPVTAGQPYWVGEEGIPELFVPDAPGKIVPLDKMPGASGGSPAGAAASSSSTTQINITVQSQAFLGSQNEARKFAQDILKALKEAATMKNTSLANMIGA